MGELGATCFHTLSDGMRELEKEQWDRERVGQLCTTSESFANWKAAILKLCEETKRCTYEEEKLLQEIDKRFQALLFKLNETNFPIP